MPALPRNFPNGLSLFFALLGLFGCSASTPAPRPAQQAVLPTINIPPPPPPAVAPEPFPVMLGIDVLESQGFAALQGKRIGLLTHPAGVNRRGVSTIDVLRRAPGVKLVALFGPEHGIYGDIPASENIPDRTDPRTGLPAYSLFGSRREPSKAQLKGIDVFVIDLQDIGVRSYSFTVCMKYAIEGCFKNGVEVMVLDRPNPLGGLKVDGPLLDENLKSGVGGYRVPYVHGLTIGEIARMAAEAPGVLDVPEAVRARGKLTVIPMRGWKRSMRWPDTGLVFKATSPRIQDYPAVIGYAMVGLGTSWPFSGFTSGIGTEYPFRGIAYKGKTTDALLKELELLKIPGLAFRKVTVPAKAGPAVTGIYVDVADWEAWRPTELSFELMRLNCKLGGTNPFAKVSAPDALLFNKHTGSMEWWIALKRDGAKVDVEGFVKTWQSRTAIYQQQTRKYWLYN
jgi:uncharacterized protein YbbC (DUF1343 family)